MTKQELVAIEMAKFSPEGLTYFHRVDQAVDASRGDFSEIEFITMVRADFESGTPIDDCIGEINWLIEEYNFENDRCRPFSDFEMSDSDFDY